MGMFKRTNPKQKMGIQITYSYVYSESRPDQ